MIYSKIKVFFRGDKMEIPKYLAHKPIIAVYNYDKIDGKYANQSDAKFITLGQSQWSNNEISAKVWRYTGEKWSRQSEELPLHRVLDLAILIISMYIEDNSEISKITMEKSVVNKSEISKIKEFLIDNKKYLNPRINELKRILES